MIENRILIIDDEFLIRKDISLLLKMNKGLASDSASNVKEAISLYKNNTYNCVICDINLNDNIDGIELVKQLLDYRNTSIIFLTAYSEDKLIDRAKKTIPFAYLLKPFNEDQLLLTVELSLLNFNNLNTPKIVSDEIRIEFNKLTKREKEIITSLSSGKTSKEIGNQLCISSLTVDKHKKNIKSKLNMKTIGELIKFSIEVQNL